MKAFFSSNRVTLGSQLRHRTRVPPLFAIICRFWRSTLAHIGPMQSRRPELAL
jgi:hypothetical protein